MIPFPTPREKQRIPCPVCRLTNCFKHCNNCGKNLTWRKDEYGKSHPYDEGTEIPHDSCMGKGTRSGNFLDVNKKYSQGNFWRDYVVQENDNPLVKKIKINRYRKLTGYGYVERNKVEYNLWLAQKWREFSFGVDK